MALGAACSTSTKCAQIQGCSIPANVSCADTGLSSDGVLNRCMADGGLCSQDAHGCGGLFCVGGGGDGCGAGGCAYPSSTGLALGRECAATSQCDQVGGPTICVSNTSDFDGPLNCCREAGGSCVTDRTCRGSLLCVGGVCGGGADGGFLLPGAACSFPDQCG